MTMRHDRSTEQIKRKLRTPQERNPVTAHAGVASVGASGTKPTQPKTDDGNVAVNAKFNQVTKGPRERSNVVMIGGK
jgi:hypothetical protein